MSQEDKPIEVDLPGATLNPSLLEGNPSIEGFANTLTKDDSSSISRHEYHEGMSAIKAHMNKVTDMLGSLILRMPSESNPTIISNIPTLGGGDVISQPSDDGRNDSRSIPRSANGSGIHSAVAPPVTYNSLPLPEPHFAHAGIIPILNKDGNNACMCKMGFGSR